MALLLCASTRSVVLLGSLAAVREFAREIAARDLPLRALVLQRGPPDDGARRSADGFESTFAVNHLGHFLLANLLLSRARRERARAHRRRRVGRARSEAPHGHAEGRRRRPRTLAATGGPRPDEFDGRLAYVNSKLCNLWFTYELARRLDAAGLGERRARSR